MDPSQTLKTAFASPRVAEAGTFTTDGVYMTIYARLDARLL